MIIKLEIIKNVFILIKILIVLLNLFKKTDTE
jgi:hypothetical protein